MKIRGLTEEAANRQIKEGKRNYIKDSSSKSTSEILTQNIFTYFNFIFLGLSILVIISGNYKNLLFLPVIIINIIIGIFQQLKSKKILDELALLDKSDYIVIRDNKEKNISSDNLVKGDIVKLESGMQIPADATVIEGKLYVNESLLTGEMDEIEKKKNSKLKSGSFVVTGEAYVKLFAVGEESYVSKLTKEAKRIKEKKSEMISDIEKIIKVVGFIIIPLGAGLLYVSIAINGNTFEEAVIPMVGAITGMIPEGLYLLVTIALAISASRLAKLKVLLHDMKSIESLARVDVLCIDKTGTITSNKMTVTNIIKPKNIKSIERYKKTLSKYVSTITDNNDTIKAVREHFKEDSKLKVINMQPFDSKNKYSSIKTKEGIYKLGAIEYLLNEKEIKENNQIDRYINKGRRVLAFTKDNKPILFIIIKNELRDNAKSTFSYLQKEGIIIKVISGDNPITVSKVANEAYIKNAKKYIDARTLTNYEKIKKAVEQYTVFGRVKPNQKKQIIKAIKENGKKVAMTGDGINDILAMKEADCSLAMGEGSKAARSSAQIVLLDSNFSHMKDIIFEGRRNINNITRSASLFIYKNLFSFFLALFTLISTLNYPLKPTQISMISFFNIGLPAFLLTFEPNTKKQHGRFIKNVIVNAIPAALTSFLSIIALIDFSKLFNINSSEVAIASIYLVSVVGFNILWLITKPINKYHKKVFAICIIGFLLSSRFVGQIFDMEDISIKSTALCLVFAIAEMTVIRDFTYLLKKITKN